MRHSTRKSDTTVNAGVAEQLYKAWKDTKEEWVELQEDEKLPWE